MTWEEIIRSTISNQFDRMWSMLRQTIDNASKQLWLSEHNGWLYVQTVYHVIETAEFYSKNSPAELQWGARAGVDWDLDKPAEAKAKFAQLTKAMLITYLEEMKIVIANIIQETPKVKLLHQDGFHWFNSILEKLVYLLRHNAHHIGELAKALRDNNGNRVKWQ